ncbi:hypothetical protein GWK47_002981 [Chionoecetes opilio]|uniref:Uncharacterized protein n=1 Tax=Chionoecetes opilio TaxID=41210 RepID=A0A8J8WMV5_CHIOP|nr:hypothetical protein GWK47_002981 [Chionoecetes opilio]
MEIKKKAWGTAKVLRRVPRTFFGPKCSSTVQEKNWHLRQFFARITGGTLQGPFKPGPRMCAFPTFPKDNSLFQPMGHGCDQNIKGKPEGCEKALKRMGTNTMTPGLLERTTSDMLFWAIKQHGVMKPSTLNAVGMHSGLVFNDFKGVSPQSLSNEGHFRPGTPVGGEGFLKTEEEWRNHCPLEQSFSGRDYPGWIPIGDMLMKMTTRDKACV